MMKTADWWLLLSGIHKETTRGFHERQLLSYGRSAPARCCCFLTYVQDEKMALRVAARRSSWLRDHQPLGWILVFPRPITRVICALGYSSNSSCGHFSLWKMVENRTVHVKQKYTSSSAVLLFFERALKGHIGLLELQNDATPAHCGVWGSDPGRRQCRSYILCFILFWGGSLRFLPLSPKSQGIGMLMWVRVPFICLNL